MQQLNFNYIRAAQMAASHDETRNYLCGVYVKAEDGLVTYVGTNGHILIKIEEQRETEGALEMIIPNALIAKLPHLMASAKVRKRHAELGDLVSVEVDKDELRFASPLGRMAPLARLTGYAIEGAYPDFQRVIPAEEKLAKVSANGGVALCFNWSYINRLMQAWSICLYGNAAKIPVTKLRWGGESDPAVMQESDGKANFTGCVMPMRG